MRRITLPGSDGVESLFSWLPYSARLRRVAALCVASISFHVFSISFAAEIPLAVKTFAWLYNPVGEPAWLEGKGRHWIEESMRGWETCGISFDYRGQTDSVPGKRDRQNVIGWDSSLGRQQRGITRSVVNKVRTLAVERDVAFSPYRREFRLHPRLLKKVMAHELGHVVGLEHADNCDDVMSFGSNCRGVDPEILPALATQNDLKRCQELYQ